VLGETKKQEFRYSETSSQRVWGKEGGEPLVLSSSLSRECWKPDLLPGHSHASPMHRGFTKPRLLVF
jgi:hypothetical protein